MPATPNIFTSDSTSNRPSLSVNNWETVCLKTALAMRMAVSLEQDCGCCGFPSSSDRAAWEYGMEACIRLLLAPGTVKRSAMTADPPPVTAIENTFLGSVAVYTLDRKSSTAWGCARLGVNDDMRRRRGRWFESRHFGEKCMSSLVGMNKDRAKIDERPANHRMATV